MKFGEAGLCTSVVYILRGCGAACCTLIKAVRIASLTQPIYYNRISIIERVPIRIKRRKRYNLPIIYLSPIHY